MGRTIFVVLGAILAIWLIFWVVGMIISALKFLFYVGLIAFVVMAVVILVGRLAKSR